MSAQLDEYFCPRCGLETSSRSAMSSHQCVSDKDDALRYMLAGIKYKGIREAKMTYFEAEKTKKPFRIVGTQKWYESAVDVRDFILGSVHIQRNFVEYGIALYGEIMRFISSDFEIKEEPKVVWHIVLHEKDGSFRKTLIACENEEQARYEAQRYVSSGVWLVSIYRSVEQDEVRG